MKNVFFLFLIGTFIIIISGCTPAGSFLAHNVTSVELSEPNFNIVAKNLEGHSEASYLIGISYSTGNIASTLALARIGGTPKLYDAAIQNVWKNYKDKYGDPDGKKLALANVRIDTDILNLLVYTETDLYITADVIEFIE